MLKKIGRFVSGRLQGSKGVKKYDQWMKENPWATTALGVGDVALGAFAAPKLLAGAGKLKGLLSPGAAQAASGTGRAAQAAAQTARTAAQTARPVTSAIAKAGRGAFQFAKDNPLATAMALQGAVEGYGSGQERRMERDLLRRQQQQQANLAQLLIPLYRQYYGEG